MLLFYTLINELSEKRKQKKKAFKIASKRIKYLEINLIKEIKDLNSETFIKQ